MSEGQYLTVEMMEEAHRVMEEIDEAPMYLLANWDFVVHVHPSFRFTQHERPHHNGVLRWCFRLAAWVEDWAGRRRMASEYRDRQSYLRQSATPHKRRQWER